MTTVNTLALRARIQLGDTDITKISVYEMNDVINETIRELRKIITQYYKSLSITIPEKKELVGTDDTGWPDEFDELIVEYVVILLTQADFSTKKQLKQVWKSEAIRAADGFSKEDDTHTPVVRSYFDAEDSTEEGDAT